MSFWSVRLEEISVDRVRVASYDKNDRTELEFNVKVVDVSEIVGTCVPSLLMIDFLRTQITYATHVFRFFFVSVKALVFF